MTNQYTLWSVNPEQPEQPWAYLNSTWANSMDEAIEYFNSRGSLPRESGGYALITIT